MVKKGGRLGKGKINRGWGGGIKLVMMLVSERI